MKDRVYEIYIEQNGDVCGLNLDDFNYRELGTARVRRVSNVEFDSKTQLWAARRVDGVVISFCATRRQAIDAEVEHFNTLVLENPYGIDAVLYSDQYKEPPIP